MSSLADADESITTTPESSTKPAAQYHDSDFPQADLAKVGSAFAATLPSSPAPIPASIYESWEDFHALQNATANFFSPKRYLTSEFPAIQQTLLQPRLQQDRLQQDGSPALPALPTLLEIGCGNGAAIYPILASTPTPVNAIALDYSPTAIAHLVAHEAYTSLIRAAVADITVSLPIDPSSVDVALLIFCLSAIPRTDHVAVLRRIRATVVPGGILCFRDYGQHDLTMLRFKPGQYCGEDTFLRADGTVSVFFDTAYFKWVAEEAGWCVAELKYATVETRNRKKGTAMKRVFLHALLRNGSSSSGGGGGSSAVEIEAPSIEAPSIEAPREVVGSVALPLISVREAIRDAGILLKKEITVTGVVSLYDAAVHRLDINDDGAKLICDVERAVGLDGGALEQGVTVRVTGKLMKRQRRTYLSTVDVIITS